MCHLFFIVIHVYRKGFYIHSDKTETHVNMLSTELMLIFAHNEYVYFVRHVT